MTKDVLRLASRQADPPWKLRGLMTSFGLNRLSLRSLITGIQDQRVALWVNVVDDLPNQSAMTDVNSFVEQITSAPAPSRGTLVRLATALQGTGASLVLSKNTWQTVGIVGTYDSIGQLKMYSVTDQVVTNVARGESLVVTGEALIGLGMWTLNPVLIAVGLGVVELGGVFLVGSGIITIGETVDELTKPDPPKPTSQEEDNPSDDVLDFPPDNVGTPPDDIAEAVASGDWSDTGPIGQFIISSADNIPAESPVSPGDGGDGTGDGTGLPGTGSGEG